MAGITIYEYGKVTAIAPDKPEVEGLSSVPAHVFAWLEAEALRSAEPGTPSWLRLSQQRGGRRTVQLKSYVGVVRTPDGYQIEVLPKVGKVIGGGDAEARLLLIEMLRCLGGFRHIQTSSAKLVATKMPLLEIFISEFLRAVEQVVKRGLRSDYTLQHDNRFTLRGKLLMAPHLRQNLCRRDRFFTEFDEFSPDRPENRLLHTALKRVLDWTASQANQQLARELHCFFAELPISDQPKKDFQMVRLDRGMAHYEAALAWARLILNDESPLTGAGEQCAPSLLFPMETVFEAFVAKHLARQLADRFTLKVQARSLSLVKHCGKDWFQLKPDLLVQLAKENHLVLDTKWKLLDASRANGSEKYGLAQNDFYQLHAYGQNYLKGRGNVVLVYPKTQVLDQALPVFEFPASQGLRLWVLPFCLSDKRVVLPSCGSLDAYFIDSSPALS